MTAAELRETLDHCRPDGYPPELRPLFDAARTIALPILEAGPELVERIATTLFRHYEEDSGIPEDAPQWRVAARAILAALITTDEES